MKKVRIAVLGCGHRSKPVITNFLKAAGGNASVCCVYDPLEEAIESARKAWPDQDFRVAASMEEAVSGDDVDMVAIFSPNAYHCEAILAALKHRKKVFSEKPLATNLEDCERIMAAEKESGISIMTGFVLRYAPIYRKVKELVSSGRFGRVLNIAASENREPFGGGASMSSSRGWRRLRSESGPYLLEKCSHDLDLLNWLIGELPTRVASFCGLDYFVPANADIWERYDHGIYAKNIDPKLRINPFTSPKDIFDNHTVILDYPGGAKVNFQLTLANAIPERRMYIHCTEGTIIVECFSGTIKYRRLDDECVTTLEFKIRNGHGGGDPVMAEEIMNAVINDIPIAVSGSGNGLDCARVALAADQAALTGEVVNI